MNIITQIFDYDTKNLLINTLIQEFKNKLMNIIDSLLNSSTIHKYVDNMLLIQKKTNELIKNIIIEFIKTIDIAFKNSSERKAKYNINKSNVQRTIYTIYGEICFERTFYIDKKTGKYYYFVDDVLGLEAYTTYDPIIRGLVVDDAINNNPNNASYHSSINSFDILRMLKNNKTSQISRQSVYRWVRNTPETKINYDPIENGTVLYIMADEKWIHMQDKANAKKKKWLMSKCFVIFTRIKSKGKRHKLVGKHIFITLSSTPYKELMDEICKIYDFEKIKTINLLSDAGSWILAGKDELKLYAHNNIVVNTCEFHVKQKINRTTTDKDLREKLTKSIYENENKEEFKKIMDEIIESKEKQTRKDKITEYKNYILRHWKGIIAMKYSEVKSSMESHISHCIASKFGSRPKAYSNNYCQKYLKLQEASLNGINILDYYLKSCYAGEDFKYNEKETDFSLFDKSITNLPIVTSNNPISIVLNQIAHFSTNL